MIRKLLLAILCITLCSCGTSHKALENENAQSDKYSFREKSSMWNSTWDGFSMRSIPIRSALQDSLAKSPKKLRRNIIRSFDEIYEKEFSAEIEIWEREQGEKGWYLFARRGNWIDAILYIIDQQEEDLLFYKELRAFGKKWNKAELKTNDEFMKGVALAKLKWEIGKELGSSNSKKTLNAFKKYLDLISENPLSELSELAHYGYWKTRTVFIL